MGTRVSGIVANKGAAVTTIAPTESLAAAVELLTVHGIGALVVTTDGAQIQGVLSERDIVRRVRELGAGVVESRVADAMDTDVATCRFDTTVDALAVLMTERRLRHVPVVDAQGRLAAIVSIGDVVKSRMDDLAREADQLQAYVSGSY